MAKITEVLSAQNMGEYCVVQVLLDNGEEAAVYVGGQVETYFDEKHNRVKAFVKKGAGPLKPA